SSTGYMIDSGASEPPSRGLTVMSLLWRYPFDSSRSAGAGPASVAPKAVVDMASPNAGIPAPVSTRIPAPKPTATPEAGPASAAPSASARASASGGAVALVYAMDEALTAGRSPLVLGGCRVVAAISLPSISIVMRRFIQPPHDKTAYRPSNVTAFEVKF